MKKIVFFDLDRTLLTSKLDVLEENVQAIKRARVNGIEVCICSGRQQRDAKKYQQMSSAGRYIICANGAEIYDTELEEALFECVVEEDYCIRLFEYAMENNLFIRIDTKYARYINIEENRISDEILIDKSENYKKFFKENKILQFCVASKDKSIIDRIENDVNNNPELAIASRFITRLIPGNWDMLDIVNSSASKGNAVLGLCKYLKIESKDVVAFGDDNNDISMLKAVGHSIAMGNASESVKEIVDEITTVNDEPGIARILDRIILENSNQNN